jgi:Carboxypeptidase regulatory-like domain
MLESAQTGSTGGFQKLRFICSHESIARFYMHVRLLTFVAILLSLFTLSPFASAQTATGDVLGSVTDASGAIIPGASVTLTNTGTREVRNFTTGSAGEFTFSNLQPGSYTLTATSNGFETFVADNIVLAAGDRTRSQPEFFEITFILHQSIDRQNLIALTRKNPHR